MVEPAEHADPVAVRYVSGGGLSVGAHPPASPGPSEVTVAMRYAGICGTDLHVAQGHFDTRVPAGTVLGHEGSGRIVAVGADVAGLAPGDPVVVHPVVACGRCRSCRLDRPQTCARLVVLGLDRDGCMQPSWVVPAELVLRLPADLDLRHAALIEPLAVAVHDVNRAGVGSGHRVLVVGAGPVGLLVGLTCLAAGAEVATIDVDPVRQAAADSLGLNRAPREDGFDVVFEVSGSQDGLDGAVAAAAAGGTVVVVGIHAERRLIDAHRIYGQELSVLGARLHSRADFERAIELLHGGAVDVEPLISQVVTMPEVPEAVGRLAGGHGLVKILVDLEPAAAA